MTTIPSSTWAEISERKRPEIEQALDSYTAAHLPWPAALRQAMRHSLLVPGKRLRPMLVLMAAEACGSSAGDAMPAACGLEMVHTYSLIHDDLPAMDDDDLRRGLPSCHAQFGEALAILAGDALLTLAFEVIARDLRPPELAAACCCELAAAAGPAGMVGGQVDDLAAEMEKGDLEQLASIHGRKTGAMIRVALRLGGLAGGAEPAEWAALSDFGQKLGLAFQIVDDILDVSGDETAVGKHLGKDTAAGKLTFPAVLGLEASRRQARQLIEQACAEIEILSAGAVPLQQLARYVVNRSC